MTFFNKMLFKVNNNEYKNLLYLILYGLTTIVMVLNI